MTSNHPSVASNEKGVLTLFLRSHINPDFAKEKAWALSPDIIPEGKANLTEDDLINSYNRWIGAEVTPGEKNKIYVRALAARPSGQPSAALVNLTAVPSELILWPQVWKKGENLEPNSIVMNSRGEGKVTASSKSFIFIPKDLGGYHYSLIASHHTALPVGNSEGLTVPAPPPDSKNWREYVDFLKNDTRFTYASFWRAPGEDIPVSISTRLRIFEDQEESVPIKLRIKNTGVPSSWEVSLTDDLGKISIHRVKFGNGSYLVQTDAHLPKNYDGTVTLNIYPSKDKILLGAFASVSLQARAVQWKEPIGEVTTLLGTETVLFSTVN